MAAIRQCQSLAQSSIRQNRPALHFVLVWVERYTEHRNRPSRPREDSPSADILFGEGVLDGGDEEAGDGGYACGFDGGTDGVLGLVGGFFVGHCCDRVAAKRGRKGVWKGMCLVSDGRDVAWWRAPGWTTRQSFLLCFMESRIGG